MTPLKQRNKHDPANGVWGDCHRAAIASVLDLPLDEVQHFGDGGPEGDEFGRREREWLATRGLVPIRVCYEGRLEELLNFSRVVHPGIYWLLGGRSKTGVNHTVVCLGGEIVHDPSLSDAGIVGPCESGFFEATFFGSSVAVEHT